MAARRRLLGYDHPHTLIAVNNLAMMLEESSGQARRCLVRRISITRPDAFVTVRNSAERGLLAVDVATARSVDGDLVRRLFSFNVTFGRVVVPGATSSEPCGPELTDSEYGRLRSE